MSDLKPESREGVLYTTRHYPCGCKAEGPGDMPNYCPEHDPPKPETIERIDELCAQLEGSLS